MNLNDYLKLEYPVVIVKRDNGYEAWHPDLGRRTTCAWAPTLKKVLAELDKTRKVIIRTFYDNNLYIPLPTDDEDSSNFSGQFVLRIPSILHAHLTKEAKKNGSSLNAYITHLLSERYVLQRIEGRLNDLSTSHIDQGNQAFVAFVQNSSEKRSSAEQLEFKGIDKIKYGFVNYKTNKAQQMDRGERKLKNSQDEQYALAG